MYKELNLLDKAMELAEDRGVDLSKNGEDTDNVWRDAMIFVGIDPKEFGL